MREVAPDPRDADLLQSFARIGVGAGLDIDALDPDTKKGLARAARDGRRIILDAFAAGYGQTIINGWNYPPPATGRMTQTRDWLLRAIQPPWASTPTTRSRRPISTLPSMATDGR